MTILLIGLAVVFAAISAVSFIFNSSTPMQLGPVPVLGGAALCVVCLVAAIARHLVWR